MATSPQQPKNPVAPASTNGPERLSLAERVVERSTINWAHIIWAASVGGTMLIGAIYNGPLASNVPSAQEHAPTAQEKVIDWAAEKAKQAAGVPTPRPKRP